MTLSTAFVRFDPDARALYVYLHPTGREVTRSIVAERATVVLDLNEDGVPVGIEILLNDEQAAAFNPERKQKSDLDRGSPLL